ncbi:MAG: oligosaccharide flippase family protein [Pseudomonadota bacterium]
MRRHSYFTDGSVLAVTRILGTIASAVTLILLTQILEKEALGSYAVAIALLLPLAVLGTLGLDRALLLRIPPIAQHEAKLKGTGLAVQTFGLALLGGSAAGLIAWSAGPLFLPATEHAGAWMAAVALAVPLASIALLTRAWLEANDLSAPANAMPGITDCSRALMFAAVGALGLDVLGISAVIILSTALSLAVPVLLASRRPLVRSPRHLRREDMTAGMQHMAMRLCIVASRMVDLLIVGVLLAPAATADYAIASRLSSFLDLAQNAFVPTFRPRARRYLRNGRPDLAESEFRVTQVAALLFTLGALAGLLLFGRWGLLLLGDFEGAFAPLVIMGAGYVVRCGAGDHMSYLIMRGDVGWPLALQLGNLGLTIVLCSALAMAWGVEGAAAGASLAAALTSILGAVVAEHRARISVFRRSIILSTAASVTPALAAVAGVLPSELAAMTLGIVAACLAYASRKSLLRWIAQQRRG